jgi:hypothetical protein
VVQVIETHMYKTEMKSSIRVLSELDWAKTMIAKHHDAIRQAQQGLQTLEEASAASEDHMAKINWTLNQRLAQIAQQ